MPQDSSPPEEAFAAALASVPGIGPRRLRALLADAAPHVAWEALVDGRVHLRPPRGSTVSPADAARRIDVRATWQSHAETGVGVSILGQPGYPAALAEDPEAPAVLFFLGAPAVLDASPRVAIVGTRSATRYGLGVAAQLGADLAGAGVVVVSGLALGIDGAAHEGAVAAWHAAEREDPGSAPTADADRGAPASGRHRTLHAAPPVGVVAGSVASPYPRQHAGLWRRVAAAGAVISEAPVGAADLGWRFPLRNRIIAAISDVVVVVECHTHGGSLHTVQSANSRGVPVGAVPGSVRSPASSGTNALLSDGCFVVRDASDVITALSLVHASSRTFSPGSVPRLAQPAEKRVAPDPDVARDPDVAGAEATPVLDALGWERCSLDELGGRSGLALDALCAALERLRARGLAHGEAGWWERS